jgi:hypothetical protein
MKLFNTITFFYLFYSSSAMAQNNTLFIDLNLSLNEVSIVEKWAEKNQSRFLLIPSNDKYIWSLSEAANTVRQKSEKLAPLDPNRTNLLVEKNNILNTISNNLINPIEEIENLLSHLEKQGQSVTTLIISGHHSTDGTWFGDGVALEGGLPASYLEELVASHPSLAKSVKTIILAGCYSATNFEQSRILKNFKNVTLIGGYYSTGYLNENLRGSAYIKNLLKFSVLLKTNVNMSELQSQLNTTIKESPDKQLSIYLRNSNGEFIAQTSKFVTYYRATTKTCDEFNKKDYKQNLDLLNYYLSGQDSPESTQGKIDIFNIYTTFQNNFQCMVQAKGSERAEYIKKVSFLMRFYTAVKQSFYKYNGIEWAHLNKRYNINYKAIDDWSRLEIKSVYDTLIQNKNDPEAQHFAKVLESQLINMKCTPPSWHEFKQEYNYKVQEPLCE